ncbi:hypothetical protein M9H77_26831 [Catharanthus roseus]|uniref:Uncharacterized protein n=1 Tax=Catharanthus roseus TaxID=4058 RepID=A0ACC0ADI0_CATRO|nr:hypothetical protein M9H77_26831 [Catharanthus roseus]
MIIKEEAYRKLIRNAEIKSEAICTHHFKQGHEERNCYPLVGYSERSSECWSEQNQETGAGGCRGRGRTNRGRGRGGGRTGFGRGILGSSSTSSGWAIAATFQQGDLCEFDTRHSTTEQKGAAAEQRGAAGAVAAASSSSVGIPGLSAE